MPAILRLPRGRAAAADEYAASRKGAVVHDGRSVSSGKRTMPPCRSVLLGHAGSPIDCRMQIPSPIQACSPRASCCKYRPAYRQSALQGGADRYPDHTGCFLDASSPWQVSATGRSLANSAFSPLELLICLRPAASRSPDGGSIQVVALGQLYGAAPALRV